MNSFDHDKLDVYRASIEFVALADDIVEHLPRGRAYLAEQLQRAATSISLNVAEGAGEFATKEKSRFYRIAKRSATECAAILDVAKRLGLVEATCYDEARRLLLRVVSMLVRMAQGTGTGTGTGTKGP
jgi:four helix bundle protein